MNTLTVGFTLHAYSIRLLYVLVVAMATMAVRADSFDATSLAARLDITGPSVYVSAIADLDGDGRPEVVTGNYFANSVTVYKNIGINGILDATSFAPRLDFPVGAGPHGFAVADIDEDGKRDLIMANYSGSTVSVLRNISTDLIAFAPVVDFVASGGPRSVSVGDVDGDGKLDVIVSNYDDQSISIYRNTSTPGQIDAQSMAAPVGLTSLVRSTSALIVDVNGDGKPDLVVSDEPNAGIQIFENASTPGAITSDSFKNPIWFSVGPTPAQMAVADLDGDGKPDIVVPNSGDGTISILRNLGLSGTITTNSFAAKVDFAAGSVVYSVAAADLDGDGRLDLVVPNAQGLSLALFHNVSSSGVIDTNSFESQFNFTIGYDSRQAVVGDLNGDGKPDIVVSHLQDSFISIFKNQIPPSRPSFLLQPADQVARVGSNAVFGVVTGGTQPLHYQWLFKSGLINGANGSNLEFVVTNLNQSGSYQVVVTNSFGSVTSGVAELLVVTETVRPAITASAPVAGVRLTNVTLLAKGTASDNARIIKKVMYQLNGGSWLAATGTTNWSGLLNLLPGSNTFRAYSVDSSGNTSLTNTRSVFRIVKSPLTIEAMGTGAGQVVSNLNGAALEIGRSYSVTATPDANSVFGGWTTNNESQLFLVQKLTFLMSSNLVLHPIFSAENPFLGGKGLYQGLFSEAGNVQHASSGFLSFQLTDKGAINGKLMIDGATHAFQRRISLNGEMAFEIIRPGKPALTITLTADLSFAAAGLFTGTVTDGNWTAALEGGRATVAGQLNPTVTGRYTLVFDGAPIGEGEDTNYPGGSSVGTIIVGPAGLLQFAGILADGTPVTQGLNLNKDNRWPLYVSLYKGKGSVLAWVSLDGTVQPNAPGQVNWIKPAIPSARYYPAAFNRLLGLGGSRYRKPPVGERIINLTLGSITLAGGNLANPIVEAFIIGSDNQISLSGVSHPVMTVNLLNGAFTGSFLHPITRQMTPFRGVFLQDSAIAIGFFLGPSRSGAVVVDAPAMAQ